MRSLLRFNTRFFGTGLELGMQQYVVGQFRLAKVQILAKIADQPSRWFCQKFVKDIEIAGGALSGRGMAGELK